MLTLSDALQGFVLPGIDTHVSMGSLISPQQLRQRLAQHPAFDSWAIYAHMPDDVVRLMRSALVPRGAGISFIGSRAGAMYAIASYQLARLQLRCLTSLHDPETRQWLRLCAAAGAATMALVVPQTSRLVVLRSRHGDFTPSYIDSLIGQCQDLGQQEYFADAASLVKHLAEATALPSVVRGVEVQQVRLVLAFEGASDTASKTPSSAASVAH